MRLPFASRRPSPPGVASSWPISIPAGRAAPGCRWLKACVPGRCSHASSPTPRRPASTTRSARRSLRASLLGRRGQGRAHFVGCRRSGRLGAGTDAAPHARRRLPLPGRGAWPGHRRVPPFAQHEPPSARRERARSGRAAPGRGAQAAGRKPHSRFHRAAMAAARPYGPAIARRIEREGHRGLHDRHCRGAGCRTSRSGSPSVPRRSAPNRGRQRRASSSSRRFPRRVGARWKIFPPASSGDWRALGHGPLPRRAGRSAGHRFSPSNDRSPLGSPEDRLNLAGAPRCDPVSGNRVGTAPTVRRVRGPRHSGAQNLSGLVCFERPRPRVSRTAAVFVQRQFRLQCETPEALGRDSKAAPTMSSGADTRPRLTVRGQTRRVGRCAD